MRRVGVFGGSFDPVHRGHIAILRAAQKHFDFDWIYVVPAYQNPLKKSAALSLAARLRGLRSAVRSMGFARISLHETKQARTAYTVDTLRYFKKRHPDARLFFIAGSDILETFGKWKNTAGILRAATLAIAARPGFPRPTNKPGVEVFEMKPVRVSSTDLRSGKGFVKY